MATIVLTEEGGAPSAPSAGRVTLYCTGGVLYSLANGGSPVQYLAAGVLTTQGDLLYRGAAVPERLAIGTPGYYLRVSAGNIPEWVEVTVATLGAVATALFTTNGDMVYRDGTGAVVRFPIGTPAQALVVSGGSLPEWTTLTAASVEAVALGLFTANGDLIYRNGAGLVVRLPVGAPANVLTVSGGNLPVWAAPVVPSLPWTAVIAPGAVVTVDNTPTAIVTVGAYGAASGLVFDLSVTALYRDLSNLFNWKIRATVVDDGIGGVTLKDALVTPTDPGAPVTVGVSIVGTDITVTGTGMPATTIDWNKFGTLEFHPQGT